MSSTNYYILNFHPLKICSLKVVQVWTELCNFVRWLIFHPGPRPAPQQHGPGPWYDDRGILNLHYICNLAVNTSIGQIFVEVRHGTAEGGGSLLFVHMYDNVRTGLMYTVYMDTHSALCRDTVAVFSAPPPALPATAPRQFSVRRWDCWMLGCWDVLLPSTPLTGGPGVRVAASWLLQARMMAAAWHFNFGYLKYLNQVIRRLVCCFHPSGHVSVKWSGSGGGDHFHFTTQLQSGKIMTQRFNW